MRLSPVEIEALAASAARDSLLAYAVGMNKGYEIPPHIELLAEKLQAVEHGRIKRLMIFMPPRHGKSALASEVFPAWYLGRHPDHQVLFTTYGQDLADGFGRKVRNFVADERHRRSFPGCVLADDSASAKRFNTTAGGVYYAVGAGGAVTGRGADLLLLDDPLKNREEADSRLIRDKLWDWFASTAYTRLMPGGAIILIQTRWHEDDLAGRLLRGDEPWEVVNLPAIAEHGDMLGRQVGRALWPERYSIEALERIRATIGEREFAALYQQRPSPLEGALFRRDWIQHGDAPKGCRIAMGVDLAISSKDSADYTAIVVMARDEFGKLYVLDAIRERVDFPGALRLIRNVADRWQPKAILIEQVAFQAIVVQELLRQTTLPIKGVVPDKDKVTRAQPLALRYEQGLVWHRRDLPTWFEDELLAFPQGMHDDAVDALVYAYQGVMRMSPANAMAPFEREVAFAPFDPIMGT